MLKIFNKNTADNVNGLTYKLTCPYVIKIISSDEIKYAILCYRFNHSILTGSFPNKIVIIFF